MTESEWEKVIIECSVCGTRGVVRVHKRPDSNIRESAANKFVSRGWKSVKDCNGPWICPKDRDFFDMFDTFKVIE